MHQMQFRNYLLTLHKKSFYEPTISSLFSSRLSCDGSGPALNPSFINL